MLVVQWGGVGDIGSKGGTGGSMIGDASKSTSIAGGTLGIVVINGIMEAHGDNGKRGGGVADSGIAGLEKGERRSSPSSSDPVPAAVQLHCAASWLSLLVVFLPPAAREVVVLWEMTVRSSAL